MKTAIIHDWLLSPIGGSENVLEKISEIFPSPLFTLIYDPEKIKTSPFKHLDIHSSILQTLPLAKTKYRNFLPLFPLAIERFNLKGFDLILSSSHCVAKGIKKNTDQLHICYCHTPMRYAWDLMDDYLSGIKMGWLLRKILLRLQLWDLKVSNRVDHFIANSEFVAQRIQKFYGRSSTVIYPPVDTEFYTPQAEKGDVYVSASRLVQNKRIDLIVKAFKDLPTKKLIVIGEGPEKEKLQRMASSNVQFEGAVSNATLKTLLQNAKAFLFAAVEDFGIAPVEAMACGTPVIAFKKGGILETVIDGVTGLFFEEQTPNSLCKAITQFELKYFSFELCRVQAEKFSQEIFRRQYRSFVLEKYAQFQRKL